MLLLIAGVIYYFITHQQLLDILITIMRTQVQLLQSCFTAAGMADEKTLTIRLWDV
jgi:hypothetical protein